VAFKDSAQRVAQAQQAVVRGLAKGDGPFDLVRAVAAIAAKDDLVLGEALTYMAADALGLGGFSSSAPLVYEGLRERYLPGLEFRGKVAHRNSQYALYAAAALHGGVLADVYSDTGWWRTADLWQYAVYAIVAYVRASAERRGSMVEELAKELADTMGIAVSF
jgi:hypothetical protein